MAVTKIIYESNFLPALTDEEEQILEEIARDADATRIDGSLVYRISSDTITDYIAEKMVVKNKKKLAIIKSLDKKLKARCGKDFDTFDFFFE